MKTMLQAFVTMVVLFAIAMLAVAYFGLYNVAATAQDNRLLYHFLHYTMRRSVGARSAEIKVPDLRQARAVHSGFDLYRQHCAQCHGAPGIAPEPFAFGLRPEPPNLAEAARAWPAADIYWVIQYGLTKTAMPAWEYRLSERQLWDLTAFVKQLPALSPRQYQQWSEARATPATTMEDAAPVGVVAPTDKLRPGNAAMGRHAIEQYLCITCHTIPHVTGASATVGPPLNGIATRRYIGGVLPNTPQNMTRWLRDPQAVAPQTAMPNLRIKEQDMRDIVAYLYTLDDVAGQ